MSYVLTHFSDLGWSSFAKYPKVENLSGVVHWQPLLGRLDLDGQNTTIHLPGKPPIIFQDLNAALEWKEISHGWQVNLDRFILRHPDLLLSFVGKTFIKEKIETDSPGVESGVSVLVPWRNEEILVSELVAIPRHSSLVASEDGHAGEIEPTLYLKGAISATNAEKWLQYLPKQYLKPKLDRWLKHGIQRIDRLVADVNVEGKTREFPFDNALPGNAPGVFEINAHVSGLDLVFAPNWPLTRDIEADLHFDKRFLTADVVYAKLQDIRVDEVNLRLNDLGLNHETLLVHGRVRTTGTKALSYIQASPIVKKLPLLKLLGLQGMLELDLQLEAPLYPQNDTILTQGKLAFDDNALVVNHRLSQVELDALSGDLEFSQEGILDSQLKAKIFDSPVAISIKSMHKPKSATLVHLNTEIPMDNVRAKYDTAFLNSMRGTLALNSVLHITNDVGDLEHAEVSSSLEGLAINLPPPLGKKAELKTPFTMNLDFKSDSSIQFQMHYADLVINAMKSLKGDWSVVINEANIAGKIAYQPTERKLTGRLSKFYLHQNKTISDPNSQALSALKVNDFPNVDLQIQDFRYGDWNLGIIDCKASSQESKWLVDYCKITAPSYSIQAEGEWSQKDSVNKTTAALNMTTSDLGKTLTRWGITPAVDARHGEIQFSGAWPGGFQDFSLARIVGQSLIVFRNGEITHLDTATEEKLGLGKLLSILSLQTLPRRLKLDFSDLVHKGYAFDAFRGNFAIAGGIMQTKDSVIDGPTASASINGNLDFVQQLYDLKVKIAPHLTSSLPIVATIAGGPIIGAATWVASKIINQGMQKFSAYGYQITGPWKKPVIKPIDIFKDWDKKLLGIDLI